MTVVLYQAVKALPCLDLGSFSLEPKHIGPRILEADSLSVIRDLHAIVAHSISDLTQGISGRQHDVDFTQPQSIVPWPCATAVPDVHGHVVVIPTRADKERTRGVRVRRVKA